MSHRQPPRLSLRAFAPWVLLAVALPALAQNDGHRIWQAQSIYQVITDRFYDGDPANNNADGNYNPAGRRSVHGGDFKGLEQKLDYIKALGATAIWISPVIENANGAFHGYAGRDFYRVDPHWGSLADLQHLVQTAHARGLLVIDDIVCNHGGDLVYSTDPDYPAFRAPPAGYTLAYRDSRRYAPPFNTNAANPDLTNIFHNNGVISNYAAPEEYQLGELSGLDDFRTESPYIRSNMAAIYEYWIQTVGFDGYRIDTVKHVDQGFWQYWCPRIHRFAEKKCAKPNFFLFGEVYDASEALCGSYTGTKNGGAYELDSVLDYPLYFLSRRVFAQARGATSQIDDHYASVAAHYDRKAQMRLVTFLDNHDQPRFLHDSQTNRLEMALVFLYTARGIPCLYYGTEQAFNGATDPYDREDMFAGRFKDRGLIGVDSFNMTHPLFQWVARLNNLRRLYPALSLGSQVSQCDNPAGPGLFAYSRRWGKQELLVAINTANSPQFLPEIRLKYAPGTVLVNLLDSSEKIRVTAASRSPAISMPPAAAKVFIAHDQTRPLDPVVVANSPLHSATNVPAFSPIVLQFSQPMDTNSVQSAFSLNPPTAGSFRWSPDHDRLTFTPGTAGMAAAMTIVVRLADSACDAVSGNHLYGGYELKFATTFKDSATSSFSRTGTIQGDRK
ncbi:MAG TPA: alpha-amylase family glycosyl hydrolase [Candidatus Acidoferrales bacterium]|nr:alpha-amylase family glycosyl hydrolase [Candidatus Acidoferrales bacterium]